jgi:hypothetical protein
LYVERLFVCLGVDSERLDAEFVTGTDDAKCDFAAVCDEYLF